MKRIFSILLITALLVALMPLMTTVALAEEYATITSENGYGVRLREGPSKAYNPLGTFDVGSTVLVLQRGDEWSQLQIGSTVGWMMNKYLIFGVAGSNAGGSTEGGTTAVVYSSNGLRVWLRATPGGSRLFLNSPGTQVLVLAGDKEWCQVSINGTIGYMKTKYLAFEKPDPVDYELKSATINYYYPVVGDTLLVELEPSSATVSYEWYVGKYEDENDMSSKIEWSLLGTEDTFEVLTRFAGQPIKVKVTGTGNYYGSLVDTVYPVQINRGIKSVALSEKIPVVGETLEAVIQPSSAEVDYSWRVGGVQVSSEATYTPTEDDLGKLIQLKVTGINGFSGSAACTADNVVVSDKVIQYAKLNNGHALELHETCYPVVGEVLTVDVYPSSADVNITWYADGEVVSVTGSYKVGELDLGKKIKVVVEGVEPYSGTATDISASVSSAAITGVSLTSKEVKAGDGEWILADIEPSNATAYYYWYVDGEDDPIYGPTLSCALELTDAFVKEHDLIGKKLWVEAVGTGVYTGAVASDLSGELVTNKKVTEVAINNLVPAVGDTLYVTLKPSNLNEVQDQFSYVWMVGTETKTGYDEHTYKVEESDIGKPIRVKVVGANGYTGEAYSAYTDEVRETSWLTGVSIYNLTTGEKATSYSPEVGQKLYAVVEPVGANGTYTGSYNSYTSDGYTFSNNGYNNDFVTYTWSVGGYSFEADGFTVPEELVGERITVTAKPKENTAYYHNNYPDYSVSATSQPIVLRAPMNVVVELARPVVGITPDYDPTVFVNKDYGTHDASVSVNWTADKYNPAVLDVYGCFLPGTSYTAVLNVTPKEDVSLYGATVTVYDRASETTYVATQSEAGSSAFYVEFAATGASVVNDLYIADLEPPVVGGVLDTFCSNDQVEGTVTWSYADNKYTACIELTANIGYTLNGLDDNVFHVAGATETKYTAGSNTIWAIYEIKHELEIQSDKDFVYLDGYNRRIIQCSAHLSNFMGKLENIQWEIVDAKVDGTSINNNGQLIIGMYEETERTLTVRATVVVDDKKYVAEKTVQIYSGTDTDTALEVVFTKYNSEITRGGRGYFEAVVSNSSDGCTLFAIYEDGTSAPITDGWLYVPASMDDEYIIVKGISNEDHSVSCTMLITLTGDITAPSTDLTAPKVEFTKCYAFVERGTTVTYEAKTYGTQNDDTVIYVTWPNGTMEVLKDGKLTIAATSAVEEVTVTAYSTDDPMLSASMKVLIVEPTDIKFTKSHDKLERGKSYTFEAVMSGSVLCDLYADFGSGEQKLLGGKLVVDSLEPASKVTIIAKCPGAENVSVSKVVSIFDARTIEFVNSVDKVSKGGYAYTFAAKATVFGQKYDADIYANFGAGESKLPGGVLNVPADTTATNVEVIAKYTHADGETITVSKNVVIGDKGYIEFVSGPTTLEHGDEATYKAVAYVYEDIKDCEIFAIWPNGTEKKLSDGKLEISDTELNDRVIIKAVYNMGGADEMSATRTVAIKPTVYIAFDEGMPRELKRNESAVYSAKVYFKNKNLPAKISVDYHDGAGYVELTDGKVDASKAVGSYLTLKAEYETVMRANLTVAIKDLPTIKFTEYKDKVEKGSTTHFTAKAVVDGVETIVTTLYADGEYMVGDNLVIPAGDTRDQVIVKAVYQLDENTTLTTEKVVKIFDKPTVEFTKAPGILIRGAGEAQYVAEATVLGEKKPAAIYADFGSGYFDLTDGKLAIGIDELANTIKIKAEYVENGVVRAAKEISVAIKDPLKLTWKDDISVVEHSKSYTFAAQAKLPDESLVACTIYVDGVEAAAGKYTVSETETRDKLTIKAVYVLEGAEHSLTKTVTLKDTPYIEFVGAVPSTVTAGETVTFKAEAVFPTTRVPAKIFFGSEEAADGKYTLPVDSGADMLTATAKYDGLEDVTTTATIKRVIRFVDVPAKVKHGKTYEIKALVNKYGTDYQAELSAPGCTVNGSMVTVPADYAGSNVTITASYAGVDDKSVTIPIEYDVTIAFTKAASRIERGDSYVFAAVATINGVETQKATIYRANANGSGVQAVPDGKINGDGGYLTAKDILVFAKYEDPSRNISVETKKLEVRLLSGLESVLAGTEELDEDELSALSPAEVEAMMFALRRTTEEETVEDEPEVEGEQEPMMLMSLRPTTEAESEDEPEGESEQKPMMMMMMPRPAPSTEEETTEPEVEDESEAIVIVVDTTEPEVEEETEEEVTEPEVEEETEEEVTEPEVEEETEEEVTEPEVEEETEEEVTEPEVEEETEEEVTEPEVEEETEEEVPETIVIVVDTTEPVGEDETEEDETESETEEVVAEETSTEESADEEVPETIVIVVDTTEPVDEDESEGEETEVEQPAEQEGASEESVPSEETAVEEEDETLDALEGDDIGESIESESAIKITFTKHANKIKLGNYSTYMVDVTGSEQGVIWSLRLSADVNGEPVSSIDQDGRVTISLDETAEKLIVVATSREDRSVRARWIVEVTEEDVVEETITEEVIEETTTTEEETTEEAAAEETLTEEEAMEDAALAEENNVPEETTEETNEIEEELITVEEGGSLLDLF